MEESVNRESKRESKMTRSMLRVVYFWADNEIEKREEGNGEAA